MLLCVQGVRGVFCAVVCRSRALRVYHSPCEVLRSRTAWGRKELLSLSVEQEGDSSLLLELLLCLEMALCAGWFGVRRRGCHRVLLQHLGPAGLRAAGQTAPPSLIAPESRFAASTRLNFRQ